MDKLSCREELIITKVERSPTRKTVSGKASEELKGENCELLRDDGTNWALDIRPIFSPQKSKEESHQEEDKVVIQLIKEQKVDSPKPDASNLQRAVFPCESCGITFSSIKYVEQHSKWCRGSRGRLTRGEADRVVRPEGKRYQCSTCGYSTDVSSHLSAHIRRHTGERPYACDVCPYRAAEACTLARHRMAHSGERPYACPLCPHRAAFAGDLQKHLRRHTGERPFACLQCPYRAARPGSLKEHTLSQHGDEMGNKRIGCPSCSYIAECPSQLRKHTKSQHRKGASSLLLLRHPPDGHPNIEASEDKTYLSTVDEEKIFPCYLCSFNAKALYLLTKHIQVVHPDIVSLYKPTNN